MKFLDFTLHVTEIFFYIGVITLILRREKK